MMKVTGNDAHSLSGEGLGLPGRPGERRNIISLLPERLSQVASYEARGAGYQRLHIGRS
jgi:hypothetical protein